MALLIGCSRFVYHIEIKMVKHGKTKASLAPMTKRRTIKTAKLGEAAMSVTDAPHATHANARHLPNRNFCRMALAG